MRHTTGTVLALAALLALGPGTGPRTPAYGAEPAVQVISKTVRATVQTLARTVQPPKGANKDAVPAEISIRYPEFASAVKPDAAVDAINQDVRDRLLGIGAGDGKAAASPDDLMDKFRKDFEAAMKSDPDQVGAWSLKFEVLIRHADEELVCLDILKSLFTGGAHPDSNVTYQVFSLKTGKALDLSAFVPDAKLDALTALAERHFRIVRDLKPGQSYPDAGFQFADDKFALNDNFLVTKEGLTFYYNPYEINPYGMGQTELLIPWAELKTLVDPKGPGGRFL